MALTLDDGPDSVTTAEIFRVLAEHRARATFFLISSRVPGNEALVARLEGAGHEIGNHFVRNRPSIRLSPAEFERSLVESDSVLSRYGTLHWARPASGWYNRRMIRTMTQHGYRCALGSVYPFDPLIPWVGHMVRAVLWHVRPGAIIVLHDGGARGRRTADALRQILPELARRGYRVTTLSELVARSAE